MKRGALLAGLAAVAVAPTLPAPVRAGITPYQEAAMGTVSMRFPAAIQGMSKHLEVLTVYLQGGDVYQAVVDEELGWRAAEWRLVASYKFAPFHFMDMDEQPEAVIDRRPA